MTQGPNNMIPGEKTGAKEKLKDINNKLKDPNLLTHIQKELGKDHIGNHRQLLYVFLSCLSSQLPPEYRYSCALVAYKSEGKDNLVKTIWRHLPLGWGLYLSRITTACLEDDTTDYNLIYIGEGNFKGGANSDIIEAIKQLTEDGINVQKKDVRTGYKEARFEHQDRKVVIFSTTDDNFETQLESRFSKVPIHGTPHRYHMVNKDTLEKAGDIDKELDELERRKNPTWIEHCLKSLVPYDSIEIPYASLLKKMIDSSDSRSQRDLKRLLNLIRSITYLHQKNRIHYTHRGKKILVSTPEDLYNALEIGEDIINQSYTGLEPRLQRIIDCYYALVQEGQTKDPLGETRLDPNFHWVDRSLIQKHLKIKKAETIKGHTKTLHNMGGLLYEILGNRCYIAIDPTNPPTNDPLITHPKQKIYSHINTMLPTHLEKMGVGKRYDIGRYIGRSKTSLLSIETPVPTNKNKNTLSTPINKDSIHPIQYISRELVGHNGWVDTSPQKRQHETETSINIKTKNRGNKGGDALLPCDHQDQRTALQDAIQRHGTDGKGVHYATLRDDKELLAHFTSEGELYRFIEKLLEERDGGIYEPRGGYLQLKGQGET